MKLSPRASSARYHDYSEQAVYTVDLSLTENPYGVSPRVMEVFSNIEVGDICLYKESTSQQLVARIARYVGVPESCVMLTRGARDGLDIAVRTYVSSGSELYTSQPTFPFVEFVAQQYEAKLQSVPWSLNGELAIDDLIRKADKRSVDAVYLCHPNNPTGHVAPVAGLLRLAESLAGVLIVDETNIEYAGVSLSSRIETQENIVILRSFAKAFGLAGMRIGYIVAHPETIRTMRRMQPPHTVSTIAIKAAQAALEDVEWMQNSVYKSHLEREYLMRELECRDYEPVPSLSNSFLVKIPDRYKTAALFVEDLRAEGGNAVVGDYFGLARYIRLAPRRREKNDAFLEIIDTLEGRL